LWATIAIAVGPLWTNWVWGSWFSRTKDVKIALLAMASLIGWPVSVALFLLVTGFAMKLGQGHPLVRMGVVLAAIGVGPAVYSVPSVWNLAVCAIVTTSMGLQARRAAQDNADLEDRQWPSGSPRQKTCSPVFPTRCGSACGWKT
jgi:O-antigen ligase